MPKICCIYVILAHGQYNPWVYMQLRPCEDPTCVYTWHLHVHTVETMGWMTTPPRLWVEWWPPKKECQSPNHQNLRIWPHLENVFADVINLRILRSHITWVGPQSNKCPYKRKEEGDLGHRCSYQPRSTSSHQKLKEAQEDSPLGFGRSIVLLML